MLHELDGEVARLLAERAHRHPLWAPFVEAHPGWDVRYRPMNVDESIDWRRKIITLALWLPDPMFRTVHAMFHVDRHEGARGRAFDEGEELAADGCAAFWRIVLGQSMAGSRRDLEDVA